MNENKIVSNNSLDVDPDKLQNLVNMINKSVTDLRNAKSKADEAWTRCESSLGSAFTKTINERKIKTNDSFNNALSELENSANVLNSVTSIWKETESEILRSSNSIDDYILNVSNKIASTFNNLKK